MLEFLWSGSQKNAREVPKIEQEAEEKLALTNLSVAEPSAAPRPEAEVRVGDRWPRG